jgi:hypothetical protein
MLGETAREVGVLVFVFGILVGFLDDLPHGLTWYVGILGASAVFLTMGYAIERWR